MTEETIKVAALTRLLDVGDIEIRKESGKPTSIKFSGSSTYRVERFFGDEVLDHKPGSVRLDRAKLRALPLLFNHDMDDPVGMVDDVRIEGERTIVDAHFFDTERAREVEAMMNGGLRNVSTRYRVHRVEEDPKTHTSYVREWEPLEYSIVSVPADPTVGQGRSGAGQEFEVRILRTSSTAGTAATQEQVRMETPQGAAAPNAEAQPRAAAAEPSRAETVTAVQAEKERREAIQYFSKANRIDARVEARWIEDGTSLTQVGKEICDVLEERGKQKPMTAAALGLSRSETNRYSLFRAIRALRFGGQDRRFIEEAGFEYECSRAVGKQLGRELSSSMLIPSEVLQRPLGEAAVRALATTPGSKGGYLVNVENMGFIDILRNRSVSMSLGARRLSGLQGNVTFPRQTGKVSVTWQAGEGVSVTAADQALGQLSMTPKTCIAITDVSEQLLAQSSPSAEQFVMADLAADVAIDGVDAAVINGTGGAQPLGIKNTPGITSGQDAAAASYAKILAFVAAAGAANAIRGNPGFVTNITGASVLAQKQRFSSTDTPLWEGNLLDGSMVGFRAMSSEQLASGNLIFGSFDEVVIGEWGVLELSTDNGGTRFNTAQVGIRAMWLVDVLLRYPQAFVVSTNLAA